jgi:hypothetical protein
MTKTNIRITDPDHPPRDVEIAAWIGKEARLTIVQRFA